MSGLLDEKGNPIMTEGAKEEGEAKLKALEDRNKIYSLSPDIAAVLLDILQISLLSTNFGPEQTIDAVAEIQSMVLEPHANDPTGTMLTVNEEWHERFKADAQGFMEYANRVFAMTQQAAEQVEQNEVPAEDGLN